MENYFTLYDLPLSFHPDPAQVKDAFYKLSRQYHPDSFTNADEATQAEALRMASEINKAYKILSDADATMEYILKLNGVLQDEEKYNLPNDFLMEMMELNEALSDYEMGEDTGALQQAEHALQDALDGWEEFAKPLTNNFNGTNPDPDTLRDIKEMYFRKKYLLRIKERMAKFAAR